MTSGKYLLDTHALIFWVTGNRVTEKFMEFIDDRSRENLLLVSSITFWEIALLSQKGKIEISDVQGWRTELFQKTNLFEVDPDALTMMSSVQLPDIHKDPFDRLLIAQALSLKSVLVTKDQTIRKYPVETFWI
jgi:PIN domain nuclease of toxin-antitoxin system